MPVTNAVVKHAGQQPSAPNIQLYLDVTPDNSYPTGGYDFDVPALFQTLGNYDKAPLDVFVIGEPKLDHYVKYDRVTKKLLFFLISTGAEVANTTDLTITPGVMRVKLESC